MRMMIKNIDTIFVYGLPLKDYDYINKLDRLTIKQ